MASVTDIKLAADGSLSIYGPLIAGQPPFTIAAASDVSNIGVEGGYQAFGSAAVFSATSALDPGSISFRNGNSVGGTFSSATSHTLLQMTLVNDSTSAVTPIMNSTILGAGMGWFVGNKSCLDGINACSPTEDAFGGFVSLQDFAPTILNGNTTLLGGASFDFKVTAGASDILYDLTGSFSLMRQSGVNYLVTNLGAAEAALSNFTYSSNTDSSWGVVWDPTNITINFNSALAASGGSTTLKYETTVSSFSRAACLAGDDACLISYASFGDPIGRGGGVTGFSALFSAFSAPTPPPSIIRYIDPPEDDPLAFPLTRFELPTFENGVLNFGAVPEPSSWLLMIAGFAFIGGRMRARSRPLAPIGV